MGPAKVTSTYDEANWINMAPLTWDRDTSPPETNETRTEPTPIFDADETADFGEGEAERTTITGGVYDLRPRFTGRVGVLSQLGALIDSAFDKRAIAFAVVIGERGAGKTRLASELAARARDQHADLIVLAAGAEDGSAYAPIARALSHRFGIEATDGDGERRAKIQRAVAEIVQPARVTEVAHLVAHAMRVPFDDSPVVTPLLDSPQRLEARTFMAIRRLVLAEAERHPVLIVVENLEHCGSETVNLLSYLAAGLRDQRVAIVATATPELADKHAAFGDGEVAPQRIALPPLTPIEAEQLLRELCKLLADVPAKLVAHARTLGGSPRAIQELVRLLLESDVIVRAGAIWTLDRARLDAAELPASYDELVTARLRVMNATERRVLEMAAAVGETSWLDAIIALERHIGAGVDQTDPDGPTLAEIAASGDHSRLVVVAAIDKLLEREWLVEVPSSVAGERELKLVAHLWTLVYKGIDEARRRGYHAVVARWLELHPEGRAPAAQEEIGRHLALAGETREAATRYRRAAEAARGAYENERAIRLFDRALGCVADQDPAVRLQLWHDLGSVYELIGDFEAALGAFERMLRLSWASASKTKAAVAFNKMGRVWRRKGDLKLALEYLERGLELFRAGADARGIAGSLDDIGKSLQMLGRYDEAHAKITEALARRGKRGDKRAIATSLSRLGDVQLARGQYESALACHEEALELRKQASDRWGQVVSQNNLAALAFELGDLAGARTRWLAALPDAETIGALPLCALLLTNLGELALCEDKLDEARSRLDNALEIIDDIEDRGLESECCRHLATLDKRQGRTQHARELAERALAVAKKAGLREKEAQAYLTLGDVLSTSLYDTSADAELGDAGAAYRQAVDVLRSIGSGAALGKALFAYGRYKAETGAIGEGKDMLRDAIAVFSRLGLDQPLSSAEKLLAKLG